jgi:hypothetical protein
MNLYKLHSQPDQLLGYAQARTQVPEVAWPLARTPEEKVNLESLWTKDPQYAYDYAHEVLYARFPAGEAALAQDAAWAYRYARDILKGRFPAGEAAIAQVAIWAHYYALHILKRRWPEVERTIAQEPDWAWRYAWDVLHDPDPKTWAKRYLAGETL